MKEPLLMRNQLVNDIHLLKNCAMLYNIQIPNTPIALMIVMQLILVYPDQELMPMRESGLNEFILYKKILFFRFLFFIIHDNNDNRIELTLEYVVVGAEDLY